MRDLRVVRLVPGTKLSHDMSGNEIKTFSLIDALNHKIDSIGVHCKTNNLVVIDIDVPGESHKFDGRPWWQAFVKEHELDFTYTVHTRSGGFHIYYELPAYVDPETFKPPAQLAPGVDVRWNAIVAAPPTPGYGIAHGSLDTILEAPEALMQCFLNKNVGKQESLTIGNEVMPHRPFSQIQVADLKQKIEWVQANATLTREQWRDGIFSLVAGIADKEQQDELVVAWTMNQSYQQGDDLEALSIASKSDAFGPVGPGTIFSIIRQLMIEAGASLADTPFTVMEILDKAQVKYGWTKAGDIKVETSEYNVSALIGAMFQDDELFYDVRSELIKFKGDVMNEEMLTNKMLPKIQAENFGLGMDKFRKSTVKNGIEILLMDREVDPYREFIENTSWDGVPRVEQFFTTYLGCEDSEYHRYAAKSFWCSMIARGLKPGSQVDHLLILEGSEGIRKTTLVKIIGGEYTFTPVRDDLFDNENELRKMHQSTIVELPELKGLRGKNADTIKGHITTTTDTIRGLYEKRALPRPRGFVFIGTTNEYKYLTLSMGWRRFLPVRIPNSVESIDTVKLEVDREQLFAEAKEMYRGGLDFWNIPARIQKREVYKRLISDPIQDEITWLVHNDGIVDVRDIYKRLEFEGLVTKGLTSTVANRIESCVDMANITKPDVSFMGMI